ncbi:ACT domain-containing protein ACR10 isoform X1 [Ricinus communis]|uniref:ACT domain-containing protein ACR n=1 Tax=Ricinus communis TaxID=3988 RepID=B9S0G4_RICCO|nr:ACT domain-containing protein ACR10 isoform X1 [Ricinus communis]EEF42897.1 amino acid binding protein, putative [Ricinus communis]|eukprot:XP_002519483.1 ACT domain-containing protein ACR10 isoform X1 [Ricinus communis]
MGILYDDVVIIRQSEKESDLSVITVNCPDKTGLGCDLCRIILFFGLSIVRGDFSTDGKWCYIVFWVAGNSSTRWGLLKKRLLGVCPSCSSASGIPYYRDELLQPPRPPDVFLLKLCCHDRRGLLHNVTEVLCELELTIRKVKVSTTPDGRVMDLFFVTDTRELLHTNKRKEETYGQLKSVIGDGMISCDIEMVGPEITACSLESSSLPTTITEDMLHWEVPPGSLTSISVSVTMDNSLSPGHTLVQIACQDHKGLLYDIMRTLKDYNIKISYGRFSIKQRRNCEIDLFIVQADGKKIVDPSKQGALCSRLEMELLRPLRVAVVSRGPDIELLVANPVELSGNGRPLVFHDITLALKMLSTGIFSAEIRRCMIGDREYEVYRVLLDEGEGLSVPRSKIQERVWNMLMGWD